MNRFQLERDFAKQRYLIIDTRFGSMLELTDLFLCQNNFAHAAVNNLKEGFDIEVAVFNEIAREIHPGFTADPGFQLDGEPVIA